MGDMGILGAKGVMGILGTWKSQRGFKRNSIPVFQKMNRVFQFVP